MRNLHKNQQKANISYIDSVKTPGTNLVSPTLTIVLCLKNFKGKLKVVLDGNGCLHCQPEEVEETNSSIGFENKSK